MPSFWRTVLKIDRSKINTWVAFRNALAVALPLGIGILLHKPVGAVAFTVGALNVSYSDGSDPYRQRAGRMLLWTVLGAIAVFLGSLSGKDLVSSLAVAAVWAFVAGLSAAVSTRSGDLGLNTLVAVIVFAARGVTDLRGAAVTGALVLGGGLLQMLFAVVLWPLRKNEPERQAVGGVYTRLAQELDPGTTDILASPLRSPDQKLQETIDALGRDHSLTGERFRMLFDQADRIRLSTYVLERLRREAKSHDSAAAPPIEDLLSLSAQILRSVGRCLDTSQCIPDENLLTSKLNAQVESIHGLNGSPFFTSVASAADVLAGQLRAVIRLASGTLPEEVNSIPEHAPRGVYFNHWLATLWANLDVRSAYFRHAVRLAVCVAVADAAGRAVSWQRSYWIPMTVAVVLKPDFTTTFSRGVLRLGGTFAGLLFATLVYHLLPYNSPERLAFTQVLLVGIFTFALRSIGPANYGVFSIAVSGLIVFLVAATGVPPKDVVAQRALNTGIGGVLALIAYAIWPTWERTQTPEAIAAMLDAGRAYFAAIARAFLATGPAPAFEGLRRDLRRARSNAETSVDRLASEPRTPASTIAAFTSILASSRSVGHALLGLEAAFVDNQQQAPESFAQFAKDVEFTLYYLAEALRGSKAASEELPNLRADHRRLIEGRKDSFVNDEYFLIETDRLTVALNTLREQVMRCCQ